MPFSSSDLQIYDQYLTTYRNKDGCEISRKKSARFAMHDTSELRNVYTRIMWKNRFAPLYLDYPSPQSIAYAVHLKERADYLSHIIGSLNKNAYSDNELLATVEYVPEAATETTPAEFDLKVTEFATPQINTGKYMVSDNIVEISPDSYSFDLITNRLHYELQFTLNEDETNLDLQKKISRLINDSDIGIIAKVIEDNGQSALEISSASIGMPYQSGYHFTIEDEKTSYSKGIVRYLRLNRSIKKATNASYTIDGMEGHSYSNNFTVSGAYHVTLHPESRTREAHIGLYSDENPIDNNIQILVNSYNKFLSNIVNDEDGDMTKILASDIKKFLKSYSNNLSKYGITINDDSSLNYEKNNDVADTDAIKDLGTKMITKLNSITLDPLEYIDMRICTYSNPNTTYPNPYITSIYSGMMINVCA